MSGNSVVYFGEEIDISHNNASMFGGGILIQSSHLVGTLVKFENNQAYFGGGISLANSTMNNVVDDGSELGSNESVIVFLLNQANYGGAIYVDDNKEPAAVCSSDLVYQAGCFFQNITSGLMFKLHNNSATVRGDDLFGGLLDRCTVFKSTNSSEIEASGTARFISISSIEDFHTVSSLKAVRVCPCNDSQPNCTQEVHPIQIEQANVNVFTIPLAAVDQVDHPVSATVLSRFKDGTVSASQTVQAISTTCSNVDFQVSFPKVANQYKLSIFADGPCNDKSISSLIVDINVTDCFAHPDSCHKITAQAVAASVIRSF